MSESNLFERLGWGRHHAAAQMDAAAERGDYAAAKIHAAKILPVVVGAADLRGNGAEALAREHAALELMSGQPLSVVDIVPNELEITGDVAGKISNISAVFVAGKSGPTGEIPPTYKIVGDVSLNATVGSTDTLPASLTLEVLGHVDADGVIDGVTSVRAVDVIGRVRVQVAAAVQAALATRDAHAVQPAALTTPVATETDKRYAARLKALGLSDVEISARVPSYSVR